jgi:hypothetical protein
VCFICNEKGHLGKSCPSKVDTQASASSHASSSDAAQLEPITVEKQKPAKKEKKGKIVEVSASSHATSSDAAQLEPMAVEEEKPIKREKKDKRESMNNRHMAKKNQIRFKKIREELAASGKSPEEIEREFMGVRNIVKLFNLVPRRLISLVKIGATIDFEESLLHSLSLVSRTRSRAKTLSPK